MTRRSRHRSQTLLALLSGSLREYFRMRNEKPNGTCNHNGLHLKTRHAWAARMCSSTYPPSSAPACAALARGRSSPLTSKPTAGAVSPPRPICKRSNRSLYKRRALIRPVLRYRAMVNRVAGLEPTRFYMISSCNRMGFTGTGQGHGEDLVRNAVNIAQWLNQRSLPL